MDSALGGDVRGRRECSLNKLTHSEFNGTIPEPLPVQSENLMGTAATVLFLFCFPNVINEHT